MKKSYTHTTGVASRLRQLGLTALLAGGATVAAHAQTLNYTPGSTTNVAGTFTDLGTTGTAITTANTDDANSAAQSIGFSFSYNGGTFTQFVLNTNGLLRLGAAAPSAVNMFAQYEGGTLVGIDPITSTAAADVNLLMPFNFDLQAGTSAAEYRVSTTGTAPNQVCTIQWKNVSDKTDLNPSQYANFTFQVKLYQTTNVVEFVYGTATASTNTATARFPTVGIKGSGSASGQDVLGNRTASSALWSATTFITGVYGTSTHNYRANVGPDPGRTYRFTPASGNDAGVAAIYTYGKLANTTALPHAVQAVITNSGSVAKTNLVATLNVTGANTFTNAQTIASLAAGASTTVTFAAYPTTLATGTNTVTVTLPADDNTANNTATYGQLVTTNRVSYIDPNVTTFGGSVGVGQAGGALVAKYTLPTATSISDVTLSFATSTFASTTYQILLYDATGAGGVPGAVLYTSPTQTRTAAASTPVITIPNVQVPSSFYIGIKELDNNPGLNYQTENPLRPATYYYSLDGLNSWTSINNTALRTRMAIEFGSVAPSCLSPTNLAVSNATATGATVTFTPSATGVASYQVVYGLSGFDPNTGGTTVTATTSPVTLTGLTAGNTYQVYVRSNCSAGGTSVFTAPVTFATTCDPTVAVTTFPYNQNFDTLLAGQSLPCGITVLNANGDATTWANSTDSPFSGTRAMRYNGIVVNNTAADDWFFTPALALAPPTSATRYQVAFRYRGAGIVGSQSAYVESLEVKSGTAATVAAQTNLLYNNTNITNTAYALANGSSTPVVAFLPAGTSTQYVGFHVKSIANQGNLYIDDLSVTAVTVTATSEALLRAINVFPNPSTTGVFDLAISGANAQKGLEVEVVNNLGQRVYAGSARDNYTTKLDLSNLATGLYHLKVKNGDDYLLRQLSIVK